MKILCIDPHLNYLFARYGTVYNDPQILLADQTADIIVFPGGPDVPPDMYQSKAHPKTYTDRRRYAKFDTLYRHAAERGISAVGICGGAQYLCVKAGHKLIQHVERHALHGTHEVQSIFGPAQVTSTHHQMMLLGEGGDFELLAWADGISSTHQDGNEEEVSLPENKEPEAVFFLSSNENEINSLAVQWHPEYMREGDSGVNLFHELVETYLV